MEDNSPQFETIQKPEEPKSKRKSVIYVVLIILAALLSAAGVWFYRQTEVDKLKLANSISLSEESDDTDLVNPNKVSSWSQILMGPALADDGSGGEGTMLGVSFRIPLGWTAKNCGNGAGLTTYVSPSSNNQAQCNSEGSSPIVIAAQPCECSDAFNYTNSDGGDVYSDSKFEKVKIGGIEFNKVSATIKNPIEFMPPAGSKIYSYFLETTVDGTPVTYSATYTQIADEQSFLSEFEKIVEQTLSITTP